jgi:hypothetical protein
MYAGCGLAGDLAGDPLAVGSQSIEWTDSTQTVLRARWTPTAADPAGVAYVLYRNGVRLFNDMQPPFEFPVLTPGVIPNLAAAAVAPQFASFLSYDPIASANRANLITLVSKVTLNTGIYTGPVQTVREMLAGLPSVQALLGVSSYDNALDKLIGFGQFGDVARPSILVNIPESNRETLSKGHFLPSGKLHISIEIPFEWFALSNLGTNANLVSLQGLTGFSDDFFTGYTLSAIDGVLAGQSAVVSAFISGQLTLGSGFTGTLAAGVHCRLWNPNLADQMNSFMKAVEQIQLDFEVAVLSGPLNINSIQLTDYGRILAEQTDDANGVYGGAKIELGYGV